MTHRYNMCTCIYTRMFCTIYNVPICTNLPKNAEVKLRNKPQKAKPSRPVSMPPARPPGSPNLRRTPKQTSAVQLEDDKVKGHHFNKYALSLNIWHIPIIQ